MKQIMVGNFPMHDPHSVAKYATMCAKEGWTLISACNSTVAKGSPEMQISAFFEREIPASPVRTDDDLEIGQDRPIFEETDPPAQNEEGFREFLRGEILEQQCAQPPAEDSEHPTDYGGWK